MQPALKRTVSTQNAIKDISIKEEEDEFSIYLDHDIYNFVIQSLDKQNVETQQTIFEEMDKIDQFKLLGFGMVSYLVQMIGILYFAIAADYYLYDESQVFLYDCQSVVGITEWESVRSVEYYSYPKNETGITDQECTILEDKFVGRQNIDAQLYFAKIIGVLVTVCFIMPDTISLARICVLMSITKGVVQKLWIILYISQYIFVVTSLSKIFVLIFDANAVIDALTVGISFIILTEIDNKLCETVQGLNKYGNELFKITINKNEIKDTMYQKISPSTYDLLALFTFVITALLMTVYSNSFDWRVVPYPLNNIAYFVFAAIMAVVTTVPLVFVCFNKCKKDDGH